MMVGSTVRDCAVIAVSNGSCFGGRSWLKSLPTIVGLGGQNL